MELFDLELLFVGEGNFSFSLAIAKRQQQYLNKSNQKLNLIATSIDSYSDLTSKYSDFHSILQKLSNFSFCEVLFEVNGAELEKQPKLQEKKFDVVVFNYPHLGIEDQTIHGCFVSHFLYSTKKILKKFGQIQLSLLNKQWERWNLAEHVETQGFKVLSYGNFDSSLNSLGYESKRTHYGQTFQGQRTWLDNEEGQVGKVFVLVLKDCDEKVNPLPLAFDVFSYKNKKVGIKKSLSCKDCEKNFKTERAYKTHFHQVHVLQLYESSRREKRICLECNPNRFFNSLTSYQSHQVAIHSNFSITLNDPKVLDETQNEVSICEICRTTTNRNQSIHLNNFQPIRDLRQCIYCEKSFGSLRALQQHQHHCQFNKNDLF